MSLLLFGPPKPPPVTRNKTGLATLVAKAPKGQHSLEYWLAWLKANW